VDYASFLPRYVGLANLAVSVQFAPSMQPPVGNPLRLLGWNEPLSVADPNTPQELRRLYGAAGPARKAAAAGLLLGVSLFTQAPYDYSPADLVRPMGAGISLWGSCTRVPNSMCRSPFPEVLCMATSTTADVPPICPPRMPAALQAQANAALGVAVPPVVSSVNPPYYLQNDPAMCYEV
jgi:hypothetical protein